MYTYQIIIAFFIMGLWNIDQIINLNTHFLLDLFFLIARSLFFYIIRNFILSKFSKWMLSFWYRNRKKNNQYLLQLKLCQEKQQWSCRCLKRNGEKRQRIILTYTRHIIYTLLMEKQMNEIKKRTWNKIKWNWIILGKEIRFSPFALFQRFYTIMIFSFQFLQWFCISSSHPRLVISLYTDDFSTVNERNGTHERVRVQQKLKPWHFKMKVKTRYVHAIYFCSPL